MPPLLGALVVAEDLAAELEPRLSLITFGADMADEAMSARARATLKLSDEKMTRVRDEARLLLATLLPKAPGVKAPPDKPRATPPGSPAAPGKRPVTRTLSAIRKR